MDETFALRAVSHSSINPLPSLKSVTDEITVSIPVAELRALVEGRRDSIRVPESLKAPNTTPLGDVGMDEVHDIMGVVRNVEDIREFDRKDGDTGRVRNIRIQDRTADMRVALWGEHTEVGLELGDYVHILNAEIQDGYHDTLEASVGYESSIYVVDEPEESDRYVTIEADR